MLSQPRKRQIRSGSGFSLLEMLIVFALLAIIASFGFPALNQTLKRSKLIGSANEAAVLMRLARSEAVKRGVSAGVTHDINGDELGNPNVVVAFVDSGTTGPLDVGRYLPDPNGNGILDPGEDRELGRYHVPRGIAMAGPGDFEAPGNNGANAGFPEFDAVDHEGTAIFRSDGSAASTGAFRFRDGSDNILEARVQPVATGRVSIQKYALDPEVPPPGDGEVGWEESGEGNGWEWN